VRLPLTREAGPRQLPQFVIDFRHQRAGASRSIGITRSSGHKIEPL
jgi:hypothetical protein